MLALYLNFKNPLYILLLFTSLYAVFANVDYWFRVAKAKNALAGSSIAHIGFGLVILGSLISNGAKNIISKNETFIHEEFDSNKNILVGLNDTVHMDRS